MIALKTLSDKDYFKLLEELLNSDKNLNLKQYQGSNPYKNFLWEKKVDLSRIICDIKLRNISLNDFLNKGVEQSQTLLNQWNDIKTLIIIVPLSIDEKTKKDFTQRIRKGNRIISISIIDSFEIKKLIDKNNEIVKNYIKNYTAWYEAYGHIAELLNEYYLRPKNDNPASELYNKLSNTSYSELNKGRLFNEKLNLKEYGLDPIQIYCTFNYTGITPDKKVSVINSLLKEFSSLNRVDDETSFEGCPHPIITQIIQYRGWENQLQIWDMFSKICDKGIKGLSSSHFKFMKEWRGIASASLTMFLYWINSDEFLPLDQNTISFLKAFDIINKTPNTYKEYLTLCTKNFVVLDQQKYNESNDRFRNIVKDAYYFTDRKEDENKNILSGSTASIITGRHHGSLSEEDVQQIARKKKKERIKGFKIIAVRPKIKNSRENEDDNQKHLKNLKEETLYKLYDAYEFDENQDKEITYNSDKDVDFYNKDNISISISAIVGENGSGKSSIAEFIYLIINKLAYEYKIKTTEELFNEEVFADLYVKSDNLYKISVGTNVEVYQYDTDEQLIKYKINETPIDFDLERFCYSVVVNYSLYGLNTRIIGDWIHPLFHKNDSYQVPIVLNPWRQEGIIDVNIEEDLAKSRTLSNLLDPASVNLDKKKLAELVPNSIPKTFEFVLSKDKIKKKRDNYIKTYDKGYKGKKEKVIKTLKLDKHNDAEFVDDAKEYIYLKIVEITDKYPVFDEYKQLPDKIQDKQFDLEKCLQKLVDDKSHITFKLKQAINYLKYNLYRTTNENDILSLSNDINGILLTEEIPIIDLVPPSFLDVDIIFDHGGRFKDLSSGEKQQVFSINTITYHLQNIASVVKDDNTYKYPNVNIIFDEVELYFHPNMQRTYIHNLLNSISTELLQNDIHNINIIFITHSPFILSDIPSFNSLRLIEGSPQPEIGQTFGANIHDLLRNEFFLSQGFMGEFAKEKINEVISYLTYHINIKEIHKLNNTKTSNEKFNKLIDTKIDTLKLENEYIKEQKIDINESNKTKHKTLINLMGEKVLKKKLNEMYKLVFEGQEDA